MKQALKDSIVKGIKIAFFIGLIALMWVGVSYMEKTDSAPYWLQIIGGTLIANIIITGLLYICKAENPFQLSKFLFAVVATLVLLCIYLIVPIALALTGVLAFIFLGVVIGCIQMCFLCSKPVLKFISRKSDVVWDWIG